MRALLDINVLIALFDTQRIHSPRQLTDIYLLGLATLHASRLATFDEGIPFSPVINAQQANIVVL
jgi:predicted nucleic acid-binding protein